MIRFYLPYKKSTNISRNIINSIMIGSLGTYRLLVLKKIRISKCDRYDKPIIDFLNSHNIKNINRCKHFCYYVINYSLKHLKCFMDDSGEYFYTIDIPLMNPFGNKETVDLILRLIEYGDMNKIKPYNLFNKSLLELRDLHNIKINSM